MPGNLGGVRSGPLKGRVLEKILVVAMLAAILPVAIAGVLAHGEMTYRLERQAESQLREIAKSFGLGALERMRFAARDASRSMDDPERAEELLGVRVLGVETVTRSELLALTNWAPSERLRAGLAAGGQTRPVLVVRPQEGCCRSDILLAVPRNRGARPSSGYLLLTMNPEYL